jgi:hypothetical protein
VVTTEDLALTGYGVIRGFLSGLLSRFGFNISDLTLDLIAVGIGYYMRGRPGIQGLIGTVMVRGGLVSLGLEVGQATGRQIATEATRAFGGVAGVAQAPRAPAPAPTPRVWGRVVF